MDLVEAGEREELELRLQVWHLGMVEVALQVASPDLQSLMRMAVEVAGIQARRREMVGRVLLVQPGKEELPDLQILLLYLVMRTLVAAAAAAGI
jgi:hypothetical protein